MARLSLRRYDVQAKIALYVSCAAVVCLVGLAFLLFFKKGNFNAEMGRIFYGRQSLYSPVVFIITAVTFLLGAMGAAMGVNSAGQKRNEYNRRSWLAFFLGAASISLGIVLFAAFWMLRVPIN